MKMKVVDAIKRMSDKNNATIIGTIVLSHTLRELQREIEIDYKPTNAERIRSMSDDELAEFLRNVKEDYQWSNPDYPGEDDFGAWVEWLQSETEG